MRPGPSLARILIVAATVAACGPAAGSNPAPATPTATAAPTPVREPSPSRTAPGPAATRSPAVTPTPAATSPPAATGPAAWPSSFAARLVPGTTYRLSPPFDLPLTLSVPTDGWVTGHLGGDFIDLLRFEDRPLSALPAMILGFGLPDHVRGTTDVPATSLSPDAAVDLLAARPDLRASNRGAVTVLGVRAPVVDLHATAPNTPLFGGPGGTFGLGPTHDVRLAALEFDGRLVLVLVLADPGGLDDAWAATAPVLDSVVPRP